MIHLPYRARRILYFHRRHHYLQTCICRSENPRRRIMAVDGMLKQRHKRNGTLECLVQLAGEYEPTWETRSNIPEERIFRFFAPAKNPNLDDAHATSAKKECNIDSR